MAYTVCGDVKISIAMWLAKQVNVWACSQRNKSRSEMAFWKPIRNMIRIFSRFESLILPIVNAKLFWNAKMGAFWIVICLESLILRTYECKALSERDSSVCILEMHAEAIHGSICAVGTQYYLAVRRSCLWLGRHLQCMWMQGVQITNPIRKWIATRNGFQNVIRFFVNRPHAKCMHAFLFWFATLGC